MSAINTSTVNSANVGAEPNQVDNVDKNVQNNIIAEIKQKADNQAEKEMEKSVNGADTLVRADKGLITAAQLEMVAQNLQDFVGEMNKGLEFSVDKDSGRDVIKVIDKKSGDLIKQYPTEEVLDLVSKLSEATGNFINTDV